MFAIAAVIGTQVRVTCPPPFWRNLDLIALSF
jgi:hypothetical protein